MGRHINKGMGFRFTRKRLDAHSSTTAYMQTLILNFRTIQLDVKKTKKLHKNIDHHTHTHWILDY